MDIFSAVAAVLDKLIWNTPSALPWLVVVLLGTGLFLTLRLTFIQLRRVGHAIQVVRGKYDDEHDHGDINHFQALTTALSATVGIGNIAGVATAIHYGGPGALFWMWLTAFFGMAVKYSECTLAVKYRTFDDQGHVAGGPMYYIERGLGANWKPLAVVFAFCGVLASFCSGNMNQANTIAVSARSDFGVAEPVVAAIAVVFVGTVILGGIKRIGSVTSTLAPLMAAVYVTGALLVLLFNADKVPGAFVTIVSSAFNPSASLGGSVAGIWSVTLLWGVKRGLYSNEAGQGSAPIAHAAARTEEPVREGAVALLEPLIDTLIICTMTGLVIVSTNVWDEKTASTHPLDQTRIVAADSVGISVELAEHERVTAALAAAGERTETVPVSVQDGKQSAVAFIASDAFVENPTLLDANGEAFTGPLRWDPKGGTLTDEAGAGLFLYSVRGDMLLNSSALTARGFQKGLQAIGNWGNYIVTFCVFLFGLSTMISWSYYGDRCATYLFGSKAVMPYRIIFCMFSGIGAMVGLETVWAYGDIALGLMSIPNLLAILLLSGTTLSLTRDYFARMDAKSAE